MKVKITEECIACGRCVEICPEVFEMGEQFAELKAGINPEKYEKAVRQSAEECPVTAIIVE
jgi:ferredoxin